MNSIFVTIARLAQLQNQAIDRLDLQSACEDSDVTDDDTKAVIKKVLNTLQLPGAQWLDSAKFDETHVPVLVRDSTLRWGIVRGRDGHGQWILDFWMADAGRFAEESWSDLSDLHMAKLVLARPFDVSRSPMFRLVRETIVGQRSKLVEIVLAGLVVNLIALAISLFSMQIYDRVIPTGAQQTLFVLTIGVLGAIVFELTLKHVRSNLNEKMVDQVDAHLARLVYTRLLRVRLDQMPQSVGGLAGQIKGYETVRGFLATVPTQLMIDIPFVLIYTAIIGAIAGWLGLIPLIFLVICLAIGLYYRNQIEALTQKTSLASNLKTGLLVETIEGAETIKSGQGGWRMLQRWMQNTHEARISELDMRHVSERSQYWIAALHQTSYVLMVAFGALLIIKADLTMGGLIACTLLSGRILGPVGTLPSLLVQWGHCRAALLGLDRLWRLADDHAGVDHPVTLEKIRGEFEFSNVAFSYSNNKALVVPNLKIRAGEKIGVLGPIGAGKTSFLRLLSGMYAPQQGYIKLDGVDISHISKPLLAEHMGYLQQEGRLFAGSLRDNLILGLVDPGDQALLEAAKWTGLQEAVIAQHPQGLHRPIFEGGQGLSGGQKQLVNLTRVFLRKPRLWLLDEPTASMDRHLEVRVMQSLKQQMRADDTFVLVTHKPEMFQLVDRLIVIANHAIVLDGPRHEVLQRLQGAQNHAVASSSVKAH
jgi:ATP-binding cassette, subfamily C, bacterial LapB